MTFAKAYERRCSICGVIYRTDTPGARWTNPKGNPRYLHPGCQHPARGWKPADVTQLAPGATVTRHRMGK